MSADNKQKRELLEKSNVEDILPLYHVQEGILYHCFQTQEKQMYLQQVVFKLAGKLDITIFQQALDLLISNNEILRSVLRWENINSPVLIVLKKLACNITYIEDEYYNMGQVKQNEWENGIDITNENFRIVIVKESNNEFQMIMTYHHIFMDGWSSSLFIKELIVYYNRIYNKENIYIIPKNKYRNFIKYVNELSVKQDFSFWKEYFHNYNKQNIIDYSVKGKTDDDICTECNTKLSREVVENVSVLAQNSKVSLASVYYFAWGVLLQRFYNVDDVSFGITVSGRPSNIEGVENIIGLFINTLPVRYKGIKNEKIVDSLRCMNDSIITINEYSNISLLDIKRKCNLKKDIDLFDSIVIFENYPIDISISNTDNVLLVKEAINMERTNYPLSLYISNLDDVEIKLRYNGEIFNKTFICNLVECYVNILEEISYNDVGITDNINLLDSQTKNKILHEFNNTKIDFSNTKNLYLLFEDQVRKTPNNIAIVCNNKRMTYYELSSYVNKFASILRGKVERHSVIGVMVDRSVEMIISLMAILKVGAAYLPISKSIPEERIKYMIKDSNAKILIVDKNNDINIDEVSKVFIDFNMVGCEGYNDVPYEYDLNDLAYVMYTSGSAGMPKGVMIENAQLVNFLYAMMQYIDMEKYRSVLCLTTYTFDIFGLEVYLPLINGGQVVVANEDEVYDGNRLLELIINENVTFMQSTPSRISGFIEEYDHIYDHIKCLLIGGEELTGNLYSKLSMHSELQLYNVYGPTETTVWSTIKHINLDNNVTIGKPIANTQIYILDNKQRILPIGAVGELFIGGKGIARGYINNDELNKKKFVPDITQPENKMYNTGDLARWSENGEIEFLGRRDYQVKIRGYRVELGEIEKHLQKNEKINNVVVTINNDSSNNSKCLTAYFISDSKIKGDYLRKWLSNKIPYYMIPSYFIQMDKFPVNSNGKVDRKRLPIPEKKTNDIKIEKLNLDNGKVSKIVEIWNKYLEIDDVEKSIDKSFFNLGGDSLLAMRMVNKLNKEFGLSIKLSDFMRSATIREIYSQICNLDNSNNAHVLAHIDADAKKSYPVSSAQKRIYVLNQMQNSSTKYNIFSALRVSGKLDINLVEESFSKLIDIHESLRTYFIYENNEIKQKICSKSEINFSVDKYQCSTKGEKVIMGTFIRPYDLSKAPLFRVGIIQQTDEKNIIMFDISHIIADRISAAIILEDFIELYKGESVSKPEYTYTDYVLWEDEFTKKDVLKDQMQFWKSMLKGALPKLNMIVDLNCRNKKSGKQIYATLPIEKVEMIRSVAKGQNATVYSVLLAAYFVLLFKYTGQEDIVVGTPYTGRNRKEFEDIVGVFVNTLVIRAFPRENVTFNVFLNEVKEIAVNAIANGNYPYDEIVKVVDSKEYGSNIFDTMFAYESIKVSNFNINDTSFERYPYSRNDAQFDFSITAEEVNNSIRLTLEYFNSKYRNDLMQYFLKHYVNVISAICENIKIKLSDILLYDHNEKKLIEEQFNNKVLNFDNIEMVHQVIESIVETYADKIAIESDGKTLTYREMNTYANQFARYIMEQGISEGDKVAVMLDRSILISIAFLGILKANAVYVPIDANAPIQRIEYIVKDIQGKVFITDKVINQGRKVRNYFNQTIDVIELDIENLSRYCNNNLDLKGDIESLAYVLYTSGSTGKPKGVMVQHDNLYCAGRSWQNEYNISNIGTNILQIASFAFDVSIGDMIRTWFNGGKLVIVSESDKLEVNKLYEKIVQHNINLFESTPSVIISLMEYINDNNLELSSLKLLIIGSDICPVSDFNRIVNRFGNNLRIINSYGLTEATIDSSYYECFGNTEDFISLPIGKPMCANEMFIWDKKNRVQPIGVPGELVISGQSVTRGYINNEFLNKQKYEFYGNRQKHFHTGDLARWLPDGNIDFLGRNDNQVKIRGFRIELGEIEEVLNENEIVEKSIIVAKTNISGKKTLIGFIKLNSGEISGDIESKLRYYIAQRLPDYMVPKTLIFINEIPINQNGKIDRLKLIEMCPERKEENIKRLPKSDIQCEIAALWCEILDIESVGIDESFFEIGGDSISVLRLYSKLRGKYDISAADLFTYHTIEMLEKRFTEKSHVNLHENILQLLESLEKDVYNLENANSKYKEIKNKYEKNK